MNQKLKKYSLYIWLPLAALLLIFIGYLIGLSSSNYMRASQSESWQTSFVFTSDEPDWR